MLDRRRGLREIISTAGHAVGDLVSRAELERPKKSAPSRQRGEATDGEHRRRVIYRYIFSTPDRLSGFRIWGVLASEKGGKR